MFDIGVTKLAIIGAIALVVIGPERLPKVARMAGNLLGRARSYMAEVKAEVSRSMELDELKKMKDTMNTATQSMRESNWDEPQYRRPDKHWRTKRAAVPNWYKSRAGVRTKAQSGAARVARFRPPKIHN